MALDAVQVAEAGALARGSQNVVLPRGEMRIVLPVQAGQTIELPASDGALYAKLGGEGNLAIVVDGRSIILSGYASANEQAPVHILGGDGKEIDIVEVLAATDPSLDIATAAGPAAGAQGASGSGVYTPFTTGPGLDGLDAAGVLDGTALHYRLIDDERRLYPAGAEAPNGSPSGGESAAGVDDEGLMGGIPGGAGDVALPGDERIATGILPGAFGPDGPGSFSFAALDGTQTSVGAETVDLSWDAASHTLTGSGPRGDLFTVTVDPQTGAYTVTLVDNVLHAPGDAENDATIALGYVVTDGNGDKADGTLTITIDDDSPSADLAANGASVLHDETAGIDGDAQDVAVQPAAFAAFEAANSLSAIGWASGAVTSAAGSAFGADDEGASTVFSLKIPFGVADSGVDTTDGDSIWLFRDGDLVVGRVGSGADGQFPDSDGAVAFAVAIDPASGVLSIAQYLSLAHPTGGGSDDEAILLRANAIQAVVTVTDGDGDVATDSVDIGRSIGFQDDGPCASIRLTGIDVAHDESAGRQGDADDVAVRPGGFAGFEASHHLTALGWAVSPGALVLASVAAGADDEGATAAFSLKVAGAEPGVDSGVDTTDGRSIYLFQEGDLIVGRVGSGAGGVDPDAAGAVAFAVAIDPASGKVSVGQYLSLAHPDTGSDDETIALANGAIQAVVTVTDGDDDVASVSAAIGAKIGFQDDGPCAFDPEDNALVNAAGGGATGGLDLAGHTGVDGLGAVAFANILDGQVALGSVDGETRTLKSGGATIYLFTNADDTMLTGSTDPAGKDAGAVVFTLSLDGAGDSYAFNLVKPIDNGGGLTFNSFGNADAGQSRWIGIFTDGNAPKGGDANDEDLLLTPINGKYVNTSATDIGIDNQHIGAGEGVRIDFVTDVNGNQKTAGGFTYADHFLVTDASFKVVQVQGSSASDAVVRVRAYDADNDASMTGDKGDVAVALSLGGLVVRDAAGDVVPLGVTGGVQAYGVGGDIVIDGLKEGYTVEVKSDTPFDRLEITNADGLNPGGGGDDDDDGCGSLDGRDFEISTVSVIETAAGSDIGLHYDTVLRDGDGDSATSPDGIDLALLASAMPLPAAHSAQDAVSGQGDADDAAFASRQSATLDDAAPLPAADDDGSAIRFDHPGTAESDGQDGAPLGGDTQHQDSIALGEVLDGGNGADTGAAGALGADIAGEAPSDAGAFAPDPGQPAAAEPGDGAGGESLADTALGDLAPYFIAPSIADQLASEDVPVAL